MLVYRLETENGEGPYRPLGYEASIMERLSYKDPSFRKLYLSTTWKNTRPSPPRDGIDSIPPTYVCGFRSLTQFFAWWRSRHLPIFAEHGLGIGIYRIPADCVRFGARQILFLRGNSLENRLHWSPVYDPTEARQLAKLAQTKESRRGEA